MREEEATKDVTVRWYCVCCTVCYLYGHAAEGSTYDSSDCERAVVLQSVRSVRTDELCVVHLGEGGSYKLQSLGNPH